ncbi:MAG TPA: LLM class flavin-dependent oxidoreductase [Xanthobacteraceae bacterium]|jgi:alkanesulfonate monooxygenase SsuD/methylene tetrahydromethanopterin reductase-like flavin-dependent oxidoreductase (luciferase family)
MSLRIGYLLPTREHLMAGHPEAAPLLELAERAERLGYDSVWAGDSLLARPRLEPLTLLAAVASRVRRTQIGTAVLLPALRNPVLLAHQVATLDQIAEGRLVLGVGIAADVPNIRQEFTAAGVPFEKRVGRLLEGLRLARSLWSGEPVDWNGRWQVEHGALPRPHRRGGPPIWIGGSLPASLDRAGRFFDGWLPLAPSAQEWVRMWEQVKQIANAAGRDANALTGAMYLTLAVDESPGRADERLSIYLEQYYGQPAAVTRRRQAWYAGPRDELAQWLQGYARAGVSHLVLRFAGDHARHLETVAALRAGLG